MSRLSNYHWQHGRSGDTSPLAITQTAVMRLRLALVVAGLRLFFLFAPGDENRDGARTLLRR